jgi:hypothetical protein
MSAKVVQLTQGRKQRNATSSKGRQGNEAYRVREHLTEAEIERLLAALKQKHMATGIGSSVCLSTAMASQFPRPVISAGTTST